MIKIEATRISVDKPDPKRLGWILEKNVAPCPDCPTQLSLEKLQRKTKYSKPCIEEYERLIHFLNDLTQKAKERKIPYRNYIKQWSKLENKIGWDCWILPDQQHPLHSSLSCFTAELCKTCGNRVSFIVTIHSDLKPLQPEPKYRLGKPKQVCPKCGLYGSGWKDKRGYVRFQHFIEGKRGICYIGKKLM